MTSGTNNILLVSANTLREPYPVYPLGVSYLQSYLERELKAFHTELFDFNLHTLEEFRVKISAGQYRYICLSLRNIDDANIFSKNCFVEWYKELSSCVGQWAENSFLIVGGSGFSVFPDLLLDYLGADYGIQGEGEEALSLLISALDSGQIEAQKSTINGLVYRTDTAVTINPHTNYLNSITLQTNSELAQYYWQHSGMLNIQTKRGCPHHCIYCSYPLIEGRKVRTLEPKQVVENIRALVANGINYLFFTDSVFNIDTQYNRQLAQRIIDEGIKVNWGAYFAPTGFNYSDMELYKKAGLTHIEFGSESFSDSQLRNYGKHFSFADICEASRISYDLGIFYAHFLILGGYGETEMSLDETFANSTKIPHTVFFPYIGMRIYPGTRLSQIAQDEGIIDSEKQLIDPTYYISRSINTESIKSRAQATNGKWIFADHPVADMIPALRRRGRKGPLWEYLRY